MIIIEIFHGLYLRRGGDNIIIGSCVDVYCLLALAVCLQGD